MEYEELSGLQNPNYSCLDFKPCAHPLPSVFVADVVVGDVLVNDVGVEDVVEVEVVELGAIDVVVVVQALQVVVVPGLGDFCNTNVATMHSRP